MRSFIRLTPLLALCLALGACNTVSRLEYRPSAYVRPAGAATVGGVSAMDQRSESPTRVDTIMGGFGNPLKTLDTEKPVKDEVADAFAGGLRARGLLAAGAPLRVVLLVCKLDADMMIGRTARIDITMTVLDPNGQTIYRDQVIDSLSETKFFQTGVFAEIDDLRVMVQTLLNRTVDRMLDNPGFRAAVAA